MASRKSKNLKSLKINVDIQPSNSPKSDQLNSLKQLSTVQPVVIKITDNIYQGGIECAQDQSFMAKSGI
jgi:hypothetical protein